MPPLLSPILLSIRHRVCPSRWLRRQQQDEVRYPSTQDQISSVMPVDVVVTLLDRHCKSLDMAQCCRQELEAANAAPRTGGTRTMVSSSPPPYDHRNTRSIYPYNNRTNRNRQ